MQEIIEKLQGKKTYIVGIIAAFFNLLLVFGVIEMTADQIIAVEGIFGAILSTTIRLGMKNK